MVAFRAVHQSRGHDGNQAASVDAFRLDQPENFLGVEALHHYVFSPKQCEEMGDAPAIGVEQRNGV